MKKARKAVILVLATIMLLTGCGEAKDTGNQQSGTGTENEQEKSQKEMGEQEITITTYEELEAYEMERMAKIISAFADNEIAYAVTENQKYAYNLEREYQVLSDMYQLRYWGFSMYDNTTNVADTVMEVRYEFHPERGLLVDDGSMKILYSFIQSGDDSELKEKYSSCEEMVSELSEAVNVGATKTIYEKGSVRMVLEVEDTAKYILKFVEQDRVFCSIEQPEKKYMEFDTYDAYVKFLGRDELGKEGLVQIVRDYILSKDERVIDFFNNPELTEGADDETLILDSSGVHVHGGDRMTVGIGCSQNRDNIENNFEIKVGISLKYDDDHFEMAKDYLRLVLECLKAEKVLDESVDTEDCMKEIISNHQLPMGTYSMAREWFGIEIFEYPKYPYIDKGRFAFLLPVKVEGLLNK